MDAKVEVFFSYAHADELLQKKLETHLSALKRQGLIVEWHDRDISAGMDWAHEINAHLNSAHIILLLVSPDFIASEYCYSIEMLRAMERHKSGSARVIPIVLRPTDWKGMPFSKLEALPPNAKPVVRWQSRDEALLAVTQGIRKAIEELALNPPANSKSISPIWNVPYRRNPFFTGREDILERLHSAFITDSIDRLIQPLAISGLGGMGKTQSAVEYAYRHRNDYHYVFWVKAEKREEVVSDYVNIASLLQLPEKDVQDQNQVVMAVKHWLETHAKWLLILDNADDLTMVSDFIPYSSIGHVLLTTRTQTAGELAQGLEIEKMEPEEGALLLLRRAKIINRASATDYAIARNVVEVLDGLPLALDQAGAYIEETGCSLSTYLAFYQKQKTELLKRRGGLVPDHPQPVSVTWSLSFQKVEQANPAAADVLRLCAFLAPDTISEEIIVEGASAVVRSLHPVAMDPFKLNDAIGELRKYSLIHRNPDQTLSIHRLVQAVLRDEMNRRTQRQWAVSTVRSINRVLPDIEFETLSLCQRQILHAQVCAALIKEWNMTFNEATQLLNKVGDYLQIRAQYDQAESLYQQMLAICVRVLGPDHPDVADGLLSLGGLYKKQGKYEQAEQHYQRALAIFERVLGPNHPDVAESLIQLASLFQEQGKYEQAEQHYQRALTIREQALGPDHPEVAGNLLWLGGLYEKQGKYEQAEQHYQRALAIREQALGPDHPEVAGSLLWLGGLYEKQGKYEQAEQHYQRALTIYEKVLGPDHYSVARSIILLAHLNEKQGKYEQAEQHYQRALAIREQVLGPDHPNVASYLRLLGGLYQKQGKYEQAEQSYKRTLMIREQALGPNHPDVAGSLRRLGKLYEKQGKYEQAEQHYQRALVIREQALGPDHPDVASYLVWQGSFYEKQGKYEQAEQCFQRALAIREQALGPNHPDVAGSLIWQGRLYEKQGKYEQAEQHYERGLAIREQALGPNHPEVASSLLSLGSLFQEQSKYELAEQYYERALAIREQALGPNHPDVAGSLIWQGSLYEKQGKYEKAEQCYQRALAIREQALGPDHPDRVKLQEIYTDLQQKMKQKTE